MNAEELMENWISDHSKFNDQTTMMRIQIYTLIEVVARLEKIEDALKKR